MLRFPNHASNSCFSIPHGNALRMKERHMLTVCSKDALQYLFIVVDSTFAKQPIMLVAPKDTSFIFIHCESHIAGIISNDGIDVCIMTCPRRDKPRPLRSQ